MNVILGFAFVLCLIGAFYNPPGVSLGWLGVALFILSFFINQIK